MESLNDSVRGAAVRSSRAANWRRRPPEGFTSPTSQRFSSRKKPAGLKV